MLRTLNFIVSTPYNAGVEKSTKSLLTANMHLSRCLFNETSHGESWHFVIYFLHLVQIVQLRIHCYKLNLSDCSSATASFIPS